MSEYWSWELSCCVNGHSLMKKWYWARTRDKASHGAIPIPLGYRGRGHRGERKDGEKEEESEQDRKKVNNMVERENMSE
ncbi:hypothetical protein TNCV_1485491 [Trichonephila clavipes]|nr:hypothetical protein TNCV_1485491 [Trichonephila clavipes]